ncbi:SCO family protein [Marinihelvus fidelis]|uniref:SCO family protein n=1 Tax=Marinihelvus fidelis TaxID=2613842 RepID=A0A5N0TBA1_9GAMM|nr:SCO family protein [Marinihelvus fidelis]KAA9131948.1 SCO family protein [Marinihelvus fidelis]
MSRLGRGIALVAVALVAFAFGGWWSTGFRTAAPGSSSPVDMNGYVLDQPRALPEFSLVDQHGQTFSRAGFRGDWSLIYFGYTYCPDICPAAMAVMAQVDGMLREGGESPGVTFYLVSVDPRRDTPERLEEYVTYFGPEFRGLTGDTPALDVITRAAGVVYQVPEAPVSDDYLVGHSSTLTLLNPEGQVHAIFTTPLIAEDIASSFRAIRDDHGGAGG